MLDRLNKEHGKPEDLVSDARATVEQIKDVHQGQRHPAPARAGPLPDHRDAGVSARQLDRLSEPGAAARQQGVELLRHQPAAERLGRPPRGDASCEEYNRYMLQILTIHEAYPGHYVQLEYSNRHPSLIRKVLSSGVFAEGWAVYTEQMMLDQGYGEGDLTLRLNQLKWYLRAVANAILDYKMHCTNMTDEEALEFLMLRAFQSEGEALGRSSAPSKARASYRRISWAAWRFYRLRQQVQREHGRCVRPGPLSRGGAGSRHAAGEVSAGVGARTTQASARRLARRTKRRRITPPHTPDSAPASARPRHAHPLACGVVLDLVARDQIDGEIAGLGMGEVQAADRRRRPSWRKLSVRRMPGRLSASSSCHSVRFSVWSGHDG